MKSKLKLFSVTAVFILGSVSCSKEQEAEVQSPKKISTPYLSSENGEAVDLKSQITTQSNNWSLSDTLNFPETGEFTDLDVSTRCQAGAEEFAAAFQTRIRKSFKLFQLVPETLIVRGASDIICSFEFNAWTINKDRHGFSINQIKLSPLKENSIRILNSDQTPFDQSTLPLQLSQLKDLKAQLPVRSERTAHLYCDPFQFQSTFPAAELRSLDDFDFHSTLSDSSVITDLKANPVRSCQILTKNEDGLVAEISAPFDLILGPNPIRVEAHSMSMFNTKLMAEHWLTPQHKALGSFPFIRINIVNEGESSGYISIPKILKAHSVATYPDFNNRGRCLSFRGDALWFSAESHIEVVSETESHRVVRIAPQTQASATYNLPMEYNGKSPIQVGAYLKSEIVSESFDYELLRLKEDSQGFQIIQKERAALPKTVFMGLGSEAQTRQALINSNCP